jgi:uncharacterized repeat protein (TIGR02543 family)
MDKYGLVRVHNPYAKFIKSIFLGLFLVLTSVVSVTTGFFGLNNLGKDGDGAVEAGPGATSYSWSYSPSSPESGDTVTFTYTHPVSPLGGSEYVSWSLKKDGVQQYYGSFNISNSDSTYSFSRIVNGAGSWNISGGQASSRTFTVTEPIPTYTISYDANGGSGAPSPQTKTHDITLTLSSTTPTRSNYTFSHWNTSSGGSGSSYSPGGSYTTNASATLYAIWTPVQYTISYLNTKGAANSNPTSYTIEDTPITFSALPNVTGYNFSSWSPSSIAAGSTGNKEIMANWNTQTYTVSYNSNLGETVSNMPSNQTKTYGVTLTLSSNVPTTANYTFSHWDTAANGSGTDYSPGGSYTANVGDVLYAIWTPDTYTVSYNSNLNAGTNSYVVNNMPSSQTKTYNQTLTLSSNTPTRTGYTFSHWDTAANGSGTNYNPGGSYTANTAVTLYAIWTIITYDITYENLFGTTHSNPATYTVESADIYFTYPSARTGYDFAGWSPFRILSGSTGNVTATGSWTPSTYDITYTNLFGVTHSNPATYTYGTGVTSFSNPTSTRTGYTFAGWSPSSISTSATGAKTISATWTPNTYSITYADLYGTTHSNPATYTYGVGVTSFSSPSARTGYDFTGWSPSSISTTATGAKTINATWALKTYTITYNKNLSENVIDMPSNQTKTYGVDLTLSSSIPKSLSYEFEYWYDSVNHVAYNPGDTYTANTDTTLYANWNLILYTVTLDKQNGTGGTSSVQVAYGATMPAATAPTREGYSFQGYYEYTGGGGTQYYNSGMVPATTYESTVDKTIYAHWNIESYTINFDEEGGGAVTNITANYGTAITLPTTTRAHYVFGGWWSGDNGTGTQRTWTTMPDLGSTGATVTLYAKWTIESYTINFDEEGGDSVSNITANYGAAITLPTAVRLGYIFGGWWSADNGTGTQYTWTTMPDLGSSGSTTTVYAKWTIESHTINFDEEGGNAVSNITANYGAAITLPGTSKTGNDFGGWWDGDNGTGTQITWSTMPDLNGKATGANSSVTLYAKWTLKTYNVYYTKNTTDTVGNMPSDQVKTYGINLTLRSNVPTRTGYTFGWWNTSSDGTGTSYFESDTYSANASVTLYAQWIINTWSVTYNENTTDTVGNMPSSQAKIYNVNLTLSSNVPTRTGYNFLSWNTSSGGTGTSYDPGDTYTNNTNVTLYAQWEIKTTTITLDQQSGTGGSTETVATYGQAMPSGLTAPSRTNWIFIGYYSSTSGGGTKYYGSTMNSIRTWNVEATTDTLYAYWIPSPYGAVISGPDTIYVSGVSGFNETWTANIGANVNPSDYDYYKLEFVARTSDGLTEQSNTWTTTSKTLNVDYTYAQYSSLTSGGHNFLYVVLTLTSNDSLTTTYPTQTYEFEVINTSLYDIPPEIYGISTGSVNSVYAGDSVTLTAGVNYYETLDWTAGDGSFSSTDTLTTTWTAPANPSSYGYYITLTAMNLDSSTTPFTERYSELTIYIGIKKQIVLSAGIGVGVGSASGWIWNITSYIYTKDVRLGNQIGTLPTPTKTGYHFEGWYTDLNGAGTQLTTTTTVTNSLQSAYYDDWSLEQYNIVFDENGGNAVSDILETYGTSMTYPSPTRTGYTFAGWYNGETNNDGSGTQYTWTTVPDLGNDGDTITMYARWFANPLIFDDQTLSPNATYKTSYTAAAFAGAGNGTGTYTYAVTDWDGLTGISLNSSTRVFSGTPTSNVGTYSIVVSATDSNSGVTKDATFTLTVNKKTVTVAQGGTTITKVYNGTTAVPTLTKGTHYLVNGVVSGDSVNISYTAAYDNSNVGTGKTINLTTVSISGGTNSGNYNIASTATLSGNITAKTVTVAQGGTTITKVYNGTTAVPSLTKGTHYLVNGVVSGDSVNISYTAAYDNANVGTGKTINLTSVSISGGTNSANYSIASTATLTGNITAATMSYTVTPYSGTYDGSAHYATIKMTTPTSASVGYSGTNGTYTTYTLTAGTSTSNFSSMGRTNAGTTTIYYQITASNYTTVIGSTTVVISKQTLSTPTSLTWTTTTQGSAVAGWGAVSGATSYSVVLYNSSNTAVSTQTPTTNSYNFGSVFTSAARSDHYFKVTAVQSDTTNYNNSAQSAASGTLSSYTVTFNSNGGDAVTGQIIIHGQKVAEPTAPERTGYDFAGWYKEAALTNTWDFANDTVTASTTIYAKWDARQYTLTVYKYLDGYPNARIVMGGVTIDGASLTSNPYITTVYQDEVITLARTVNTGFTFDGWYTVASGGTVISNASSYNLTYTYAADQTLYARYRDTQNPSLSVSESTATSTSHPHDDDITLTATYSDNYGVKYITDPSGNKIGVMNDDNLVDYTNWVVGTNGSQTAGSGTDWNRNQSSTSDPIDVNKIIEYTNPWGQTDVTWASLENDIGKIDADGSGPDGGWNTSSFAIDNTKTYRFSTWIRRENAGTDDGTAYFGLHGYGSTNGVSTIGSSTYNTNPYFKYQGDGLKYGSGWTLWVGYVVPYDLTSEPTFITDTKGVYLANGSRDDSVATTYQWHSSTTSANFRSYLYYSAKVDERMYWYRPRVDLVDGTEPSVEQLLAGYEAPNVVDGFTTSGSITYDVTESGIYTFVAEDYAGNTTTVNQAVYIDKVAPTITVDDDTITLNNASAITSYNFKTGVTVSDTDYAGTTGVDITSRLVATYFKADGTTSITEATARTELYEGRSVVVKYNATDLAGNAATEQSRTVSPLMYTITFMNTDDSTTYSSGTWDITHATVSVLAGESIGSYTEATMPNNPTLTGHNFEGWNTAHRTTSGNVTDATIINANDTWYAAYSVLGYTLTARVSTNGQYVAGGGTVKIGTGSTTTTTISETDIDYNTAKSVTASNTTGYSFMGWSTSANGAPFTTDNPYAFNMPAPASGNEIIYYAIFKENFTLEVNAITNGNAIASAKGGTVNIVGWGWSAAATDSDGSIPYGTAVSIIATANTGYTFQGWYTEATGGTQVSTSATYGLPGGMPFNNVTYYARFLGNVVTGVTTAASTTTSDTTSPGDGGSPAYSGTLRVGYTIDLDANMRSEYSFAGWTTSNGGGTITSASATDATYEFVAADAGKTIAFTASYTQNGITISNTIADLIYNNSEKQPSVTVKDATTSTTITTNYTVSYSNNTDAGVATVTVSGAGHYEGQSASATFTIKYPEVTFSANGGSITADKAYPKYGTTDYYTTATGSTDYTFVVPTRTGYTFIGYADADDAASANYITYNGSNFTVAKNWDKDDATTTLYAVWTARITFNYNDGRGVYATRDVIYNYSINSDPNISMPDDPVRPGYDFESWNTSADGTGNARTGATIVTVADIWYAIWSDAITYTVTLNPEGGSNGTTSVNPTYDSPMPTGESIVAPTRSGFTFKGYYSSQYGDGVQYYTSSMASARTWDIASNTTLYARWDYTVTFHANGGTGSASSTTTTITDGKTGTLATQGTLALSNFTFDGWNTQNDNSGTSYVAGATGYSNATGNTTLYASWYATITLVADDENRDTISGATKNGWNWNSTTEEFTKIYYRNSAIVSLPDAPTQTNYLFTGWYSGTGGSGSNLTTATTVGSIVTYYANWTAKDYTVTFDKQINQFYENQSVFGIVVGGTYSGTITDNTNIAGPNDGEMIFGEGTFTHPNGTTYTYLVANNTYSPGSAYELSTNLEVGSTGTRFIMFAGSDMTRFSLEAYNTAPFRIVQYIDNEWRYYANGNTHYSFTPNANDAIVGYMAKTTTSGGYDISSVGSYPFVINSPYDAVFWNGNGTDSVSATYDAAMPSASAPTRTGYTFDGYYSGADYTNNMTFGSLNATSYRLSPGGSYVNNYNFEVGYTILFDITYDGTLSSIDVVDVSMPSASYKIVNGNRVYGQHTITSKAYANYSFIDFNFSTLNSTTYTINKFVVLEEQYYTSSMASAKNMDISGDTTLYAKWNINSYYFDVNTYLNSTSYLGGYEVFTFSVKVNDVIVATNVHDFYQQFEFGSIMEVYNITQITGATYDSYSISTNFMELADSTAANILVALSGAGDGAVRLNAEPITYNIVYALGGGSVGAGSATSYDFDVNNQTKTVNDPTRVGYNFTGWSVSIDGSGSPTISGTTLTIPADSYGDITLTASWAAKNDYTITFDKEGGTGGSDTVENVTFDAAMPTGAGVTAPSKTGYTFAGYYDGDNGTGTQYYTSAMASARTWNKDADTTLYAKWVANELTFNDATLTDATYKTSYESGAITGATNGTGSYSYSVTNWDGLAGLSFNDTTMKFSGTPTSNIGTYNIEVTATDDNSAASKVATFALTISAKTITITWTHASPYTYDGNAKTVTYSDAGIVSGDDVTLSVTGDSATNAGDYTATVSKTGTQAGNYTLSNETLNWTIAKASTTITMSASDLTVFVGQSTSLTATLQRGSTNLGSRAITTNWTYTTNATVSASNTNASGVSTISIEGLSARGATTVTVSYAGDANHNATNATFNLTITQLTVTINAATNGTTAISATTTAGTYSSDSKFINVDYDDTVYIFASSDTGYHFLAWSKNNGTGTITSTTTANTTVTGVQTSVVVSVAFAANELIFADATLTAATYKTSYESGEVTAASNGTGSYSYSVTNWDGLAGLSFSETTMKFSGTPTSNIGTYNIEVTATDDNSAASKVATFALTINAKTITITWTHASPYTYDGNAKTVTYSDAGIVSGDDVTLSVTGDSATNVGDYTATVSKIGTQAGNYTLSNETLNWTIEKASTTITMSASDLTVFVGQSTSLTATLQRGSTNLGSRAITTNWTYTTNATVSASNTNASGVSTISIEGLSAKAATTVTVSFAGDANHNATNATFNLTITQLTVTINAATNGTTAISDTTTAGTYSADSKFINVDYDDTVYIFATGNLGYNFSAWSKDSGTGTITSTTTANTTITGVQTNVVVSVAFSTITYNITYQNTKGATNTNPTTYTIESSTITFTALPDVDGYEFNSWDIATIDAGSTDDKTITAAWDLISYTITYDNTKGATSSVNPTSYTIETETINFAAPDGNLPVGYVFNSWSPASLVTGSTGNVVITASWDAITYTVTFNKNDALATGTMNDQTFTFDVSQALTANTYSKTGYYFTGWATTAVGTVAYDDEEVVTNLTSEPLGTVTLYAKWAPNVYTLTFDANGGSIASNANWTGSGASATKQVTYDAQIGIIPTANEVTKAGYEFGGVMIDDVFIDNTTVWNYDSNKTAVVQWNFTATITITVTHNAAAEVDAMAFMKLTNTTSGEIWTYPLTNGASYVVTVYDISSFEFIIINTTNHTTGITQGASTFNVSESGTNTVIQLELTRSQYGYIYDTKYVE